jgi:hypothetical protein
MATSESFTLPVVRVFAYRSWQWLQIPYVWRALSGSAEVAQGKPTSQSTTEVCCNGGDSSRAVDGKTGWNYNTLPATCSSTIGNPGSMAWWM